MASLDVGGFCSGIKKSNYLPKDFSHSHNDYHATYANTKKPQNSLRFLLLHSKAILLQVVIVFHNNAKKPWFKEWRIAFGRKRIFNTLARQLIKKGINCFTYQGKKEPSKTS